MGVAVETELLEARCEYGGRAIDAKCDSAKPLRTMINGVKHRHNGQQRLRGTNIGRGLFTADMLLAGLHGHAQRGFSAAVYRHTNDAARYGALMLVFGCKEGCVGTSKAHGYAKALSAANDNIGTLFAWRCE